MTVVPPGASRTQAQVSVLLMTSPAADLQLCIQLLLIHDLCVHLHMYRVGRKGPLTCADPIGGAKALLLQHLWLQPQGDKRFVLCMVCNTALTRFLLTLALQKQQWVKHARNCRFYFQSTKELPPQNVFLEPKWWSTWMSSNRKKYQCCTPDAVNLVCLLF